MSNIPSVVPEFPIVNLQPGPEELQAFASEFTFGDQQFVQYPFHYKQHGLPNNYSLLTASSSDKALNHGLQDNTDSLGDVTVHSIIVRNDDDTLSLVEVKPKSKNTKGRTYGIEYPDITIGIDSEYATLAVMASIKVVGFFLTGVRVNVNRRPG